MPIEFPCAGCGKALRVAKDLGLETARCMSCGHVTPVPVESRPIERRFQIEPINPEPVVAGSVKSLERPV